MDLGSEMVQVIVGAEKKPFIFHKNLIRQHSEYFSRAFGPNFKEGEEGIVYLAEADETSCRLFQTWVYLQIARSLHPLPATYQKDEGLNSIFSVDAPVSTGALLSTDTEGALRRRLIALYIFADAYECLALRNDVMTALVRIDIRSATYMGCNVAPLISRSVPSSSTLCRYIFRSMAIYWPPGHDVSEEQELQPHDLMTELSAIESQLSPGTYPADHDDGEGMYDPCSFHEHAKDEEMELCDSITAKGLVYIDALISECLKVVDAQSSN